MTREKFPEKIPFRLTRMLINAMEVTGIEGTYRRTCENVMTVLRRNKDSLMAVLEAFVYDPLLNWRLLDQTTHIERPRRSRNEGTVDSLSGSGDETTMELMSLTTRNDILNITGGGDGAQPPEVTNKKARAIVDRVKQKLTGADFNTNDPVSVQRQVDLLIQQATNNENLCQCYIGWCPFW